MPLTESHQRSPSEGLLGGTSSVVTVAPVGASVHSRASPLELTFNHLLAVNEFGVSVSPRNVVEPPPPPPPIPLIGCQVLSPLKYVVASAVPVADNSVIPTVSASIFQFSEFVPAFDTVISPLSPSVTPPPPEALIVLPVIDKFVPRVKYVNFDSESSQKTILSAFASSALSSPSLDNDKIS